MPQKAHKLSCLSSLRNLHPPHTCLLYHYRVLRPKHIGFTFNCTTSRSIFIRRRALTLTTNNGILDLEQSRSACYVSLILSQLSGLLLVPEHVSNRYEVSYKYCTWSLLLGHFYLCSFSWVCPLFSAATTNHHFRMSFRVPWSPWSHSFYHYNDSNCGQARNILGYIVVQQYPTPQTNFLSNIRPFSHAYPPFHISAIFFTPYANPSILKGSTTTWCLYPSGSAPSSSCLSRSDIVDLHMSPQYMLLSEIMEFNVDELDY